MDLKRSSTGAAGQPCVEPLHRPLPPMPEVAAARVSTSSASPPRRSWGRLAAGRSADHLNGAGVLLRLAMVVARGG
eukprot:7119908-Alexandrium_andersonii.AAC.1